MLMTHTRAFALACVLLATPLAGPAIAADPIGPAQKAPAGWFQIAEQIAPRVHLLRQREVFQPSPTGNILVVDQADGLVLLDSGGSHGEGERIVALVRQISPKPVKAVIVSHWHNDHPLGLTAIRAAWPKVRIIASKEAAADIAGGRLRGVPFARDPEWEAKQVKAADDFAPQFAKKADDPALSPEERQGSRELLGVLAQTAIDTPGTFVVTPTETFSGRLTLPDAAVPIEVVQLGRGNTDGDAAVWLPKQKILATGDVVVSPVPYGFNVYPAEWIAVLEKVKAYDFEILVPGHGLPQRDRAYVDKLIGVMRDLRAQVAPLVAQGLTKEEVRKRVDVAAHTQAFAGADAWRRDWFSQYWLDPYTASVYAEAKGEPLGPKPLPAKPAS